MVQVSLARGWDLDVERGPDWLFVCPRRAADGAASERPLAEQIWSLLEQNFSHRLVLELGDIGPLTSELIGQLAWLETRLRSHDGMLRMCGLSSENYEVLERCRSAGRLPLFRDREEAVMGRTRPGQPR